MRNTLLLLVILLALGGGIGSWYFSDHESAKRKLMTSLEQISDAAMAMDQPTLLSQVDQFLAPDGKITLNVKFKVFAMGSSGARGWDYTHNNAQFAAFLTEMIGKVNSYGMHLGLKELNLDEQDPSEFTATISTSGFGTGVSIMMGRSMGTRYVILGDCSISGTITDRVQVRAMDCPISLMQQADLNSPKLQEAIQELKGLKP